MKYNSKATGPVTFAARVLSRRRVLSLTQPSVSLALRSAMPKGWLAPPAASTILASGHPSQQLISSDAGGAVMPCGRSARLKAGRPADARSSPRQDPRNIITSTRRSLWIGLAIICVLVSACLGAYPGTTEAPQRKKIPPKIAVYHNNRGVKFLQDKLLDQAEIEFKTAAEASPDYPEAWSNLGLVLKLKGEYGAAIAAFRKAIVVDAKWATPVNHLGTTYLAQKQYRLAEAAFDKAIKIDGKFADAYYNRGVIFLRRAQEVSDPKPLWKNAMHDLKKATELDPNLYFAHMDLGDLYARFEDWEKALIRYRLATETRADRSEPWAKMGELYLKKGDGERAKASLTEALKRDPQNADLFIQLGRAYLEMKMLGDAEAALQHALQLNAQSAAAHFYLGYNYFLQGNYELARSSLGHALALRPTDADASFQRAMTYAKTGQSSEAIQGLKATLQIDPEHLPTLYNLGLLLHESGVAAEARPYLCDFAKRGEAHYPQEVKIAKKVAGGC